MVTKNHPRENTSLISAILFLVLVSCFGVFTGLQYSVPKKAAVDVPVINNYSQEAITLRDDKRKLKILEIKDLIDAYYLRNAIYPPKLLAFGYAGMTIPEKNSVSHNIYFGGLLSVRSKDAKSWDKGSVYCYSVNNIDHKYTLGILLETNNSWYKVGVNGENSSDCEVISEDTFP